LTTIINSISESRNLDLDTLNKILDKGILLSEEALEQKLIDGIGFKYGFYGHILSEFNLPSNSFDKFLFSSVYMKKAGPYYEKSSYNKIAVVYCHGSIAEGESNQDSMGSDTIARAIRLAVHNNDKGIIIHVDSPGKLIFKNEVVQQLHQTS
jgi:protease IV